MPNTILAADLTKLRDELLRRNSQLPDVKVAALPSVINDFSDYQGSYIGGLTYPLKLNGKGGLSLSYNADRIKEQIMEVLETRIGERVYRQFFGMPDVLFDSISEDVLANQIRRQLTESLPQFAAVAFDITIRSTDEGTMVIVVSYDFGGAAASARQTLYYSISL